MESLEMTTPVLVWVYSRLGENALRGLVGSDNWRHFVRIEQAERDVDGTILYTLMVVPYLVHELRLCLGVLELHTDGLEFSEPWENRTPDPS